MDSLGSLGSEGDSGAAPAGAAAPVVEDRPEPEPQPKAATPPGDGFNTGGILPPPPWSQEGQSEPPAERKESRLSDPRRSSASPHGHSSRLRSIVTRDRD